MFHTQAAEIQIDLDEAKKKVKLLEALERLQRNKDYKLLIEEEYLRQEPLRLVSCLADPALQAPHMQASFVADMRAGSALNSFYLLVRRNGEAAYQAIKDGEEQLENLRGEGGD